MKLNCVKCEVRRAKVKAGVWLFLGAELKTVAKRLSECYGEEYYVEGNRLYRMNKMAPHSPILIWSKE